MTDSGRPSIPFHEKVATATGLAGLLAEGALKRCCERAQVELERMTPKDLQRLLPYLEPVLVLYLAPEELKVSLEKLRKLAESESAPRRP
jgi:hypothetical protein